MKRIEVGVRAVLLLLFILIPVSVYGGNIISVPHGFLKGNDWMDYNQSSKAGYSTGIIDGIIFASAWERGGSSLEWLSPCVVGMTNSQVSAIIQKYINDNPGDWHDDMHAIVFKAFLDTCNNSPKNKSINK